MPRPKINDPKAAESRKSLTLFDAELMLKLAQKSVRDSRAALVAAYNAQIQSEKSLEEAFAYLRDLNASVAA